MQAGMELVKTERIGLWLDWSNQLATLSPRTSQTYEDSLKLFLQFHKLHPDTQASADFVIACQQTEVMAYVAELYRLRRAPGTITLRVAALNSLFNFLYESNYRDKRLHVKIQQHDIRVKPTKTIPWQTVTLRINQRLAQETAAGLEISAVYAALFYAGLRIREALALRVCDIEEQEGVTIINLQRTKARKSAQVVISDDGASIIWLHLKQLKAMQPVSPSTLLFGIHYHSISRFFRQDFKAGCHAARKSAITRLLEIMRENQGNPDAPQITLDDVQRFARLSSIKMVSIYDGQKRQLKDSPGRLL